MNEDRDPLLQKLFIDAEAKLPEDEFISRINIEIGRLKKRNTFKYIILGFIILVFLLLAATPLKHFSYILMQGLSLSVINTEISWIDYMISPLNNVAAVIGIGFLFIRKFYRKVFIE